MKQSLDDIVFENRNKDYGSFFLRKRYFGRLLISYLISVSGTLLLALGFFWYINADSDKTIYVFPSSYPNLKSTQGSLMDPEDLASYLKNPESPKQTETVTKNTRPTDILHSFELTDKPTPDTLISPVDIESPVTAGTGLGLESDSAVFGGYLLGEGEGGGIGTSLDKFPEFPGGGLDGVRRYIELTVVYPVQAIKHKIYGVVIVSFDVNKQGEVDNIQIERGVNPMLDTEAIKAVRNMPRWKPGIRHGKPVIVKFVIPVRFMPIS